MPKKGKTDVKGADGSFDPQIFSERHVVWPSGPVVSDYGPQLRKLRYVNDEKIDSLLTQLGADIRAKKVEKKFGFRGLAAEGSLSATSADSKIEIEKRIDLLISELRDAGKLSGIRPCYLPQYPNEDPPFVIERCTARQFIFGKSLFSTDLGISALKLWVSEPAENDFRDQPYHWDGSFLFLTEVHFDNQQHRHMISGCSALRFISNKINNRSAIDVSGPEILGRWDKRPMTEKLIGLGATPGSVLPIETLYSIRYMTDEQYTPNAPQGGRVHDILGYPLFISSAV